MRFSVVVSTSALVDLPPFFLSRMWTMTTVVAVTFLPWCSSVQSGPTTGNCCASFCMFATLTSPSSLWYLLDSSTLK